MDQVPWGAIVGGTLLLLLGLYLVFYQEMSAPIGDVLSKAIVAKADPGFLRWLRWLGVLTAVRGLYVITTAYLPDTQLVRTLTAFGGEGLSLLSIPLVLWLRDNTQVIPVISLVDGELRVRSLQAAGVVRSALNVLITVILLGVAFSVAKIVIGTGSGSAET
jgi:hypothetical protein